MAQDGPKRPFLSLIFLVSVSYYTFIINLTLVDVCNFFAVVSVFRKDTASF